MRKRRQFKAPPLGSDTRFPKAKMRKFEKYGCMLFFGINILCGGCYREACRESPDDICGMLTCTVVDVKQYFCEYRDYANCYYVRLEAKLRLRNGTRETLSVKSFLFENLFSETKVYARDREGRVWRCNTLGTGPIRELPETYAICGLEPNASCEYQVMCSVVVYRKKEGENLEMEWGFPCREAWLFGERITAGESVGEVDVKIKVENQNFWIPEWQ